MKGRQRDKQHLRFIATCRCIKCGDDSSMSDREAAHYRRADARIAKPITGNSIKPDDWFVVPLCTPCHAEQTRIGEFAFWHLGPDVPLISLMLYVNSEDAEACEQICQAAFRSWAPESTERLGKHGTETKKD